ncbi:MAG: MerR family transcriptional regulator [Oscillospiraceae bacterium]|nr:MerR family transcriptional regulator [Oscillospiraceae bacterium]
MTIKEVSEKYGISSDTLRYYERVGMIPPVERTEGGIRNYGEDDIKWVELVLCMRSAGLPIEAIIEYVRLSRLGDSTFKARLELLSEQREALISQKEKIDEMLSRLNYKISKYEEAVKTGKISWDEKPCECLREEQK